MFLVQLGDEFQLDGIHFHQQHMTIVLVFHQEQYMNMILVLLRQDHHHPDYVLMLLVLSMFDHLQFGNCKKKIKIKKFN